MSCNRYISVGGDVGDITGPGFSTDNAIVRWDGDTGKIIQNSGVILDDANNITNVNTLTVVTLIATDVITTGDNIIELNNDVTGTPTENAGIEVNRGIEPPAQLLWNESNDRWYAGESGDMYQILTTRNITVTEANILTDGFNADGLHYHEAVGTVPPFVITVDNTPTEAYSETLDEGKSYKFKAKVVVTRLDAPGAAIYEAIVNFRREVGGAAEIASSVFSPVAQGYEIVGSIDWVEDGNKARLNVTGENGKTIKWQPQVERELLAS